MEYSTYNRNRTFQNLCAGYGCALPGNLSGNLNLPYNYFNAALFFNADGSISDYEKANLVPVVERLPFVEFFNAVDVFGWVDWGRIQQFGKGNSPDMLETPQFKTPGLICYDSVYPSWIREFVRNEASFITIITNDGWWGNTSGHHQHFAYARLRAIEFDRWVARSANNGISGIIAPNGEIIQQNGVSGFEQDLPVRFITDSTQTSYTRFGDWLPILCLSLVVGFGAFFASRKNGLRARSVIGIEWLSGN
ncbi:apolipoprotein N-acyltransferase [Rhodohalobacter sp.]|uniref:apolipoprotein N-acyltransferase n=1 Tax=Rhodohalobacter sp. TaxID=1974210 RepID=UPI002ACDB6E7|nr:apolipoprotein N-acyltransferase [Rhodohalobacter sp.]MDZ7756047.1 apolipoprotein N-acyltransferase [Rhodohalobacter sp.]